MDAEHPFGQGEYYFSESQKQLVRVDEMAMPYARNVMQKLTREYGDAFLGSPLHDSLLSRLTQRTADLRLVLAGTGAASIYTGEGGTSVSAARSRLRRAGAERTHKNGDFVEGTREVVEINVKVRVH